MPKEKMSAGVCCAALAHASGLRQNWFPERRFPRPGEPGGSTTASSRSVICTLLNPIVPSLCVSKSIMMLAGLMSVGDISGQTFGTVGHGRRTCVIDALVVQVGHAGERIPQYLFLTEGAIAVVSTSCKFVSRNGYTNM
jgi:hypothetical protein